MEVIIIEEEEGLEEASTLRTDKSEAHQPHLPTEGRLHLVAEPLENPLVFAVRRGKGTAMRNRISVFYSSLAHSAFLSGRAVCSFVSRFLGPYFTTTVKSPRPPHPYQL